jgi:hypothetical protein
MSGRDTQRPTTRRGNAMIREHPRKQYNFKRPHG